MLPFKKSLVVLISIVSVLAIIAIITGLSPLYWPREEKYLDELNNGSTMKAVSNMLIKFNETTINTTISPSTKLEAETSKKFSSTPAIGQNTTAIMSSNVSISS